MRDSRSPQIDYGDESSPARGPTSIRPASARSGETAAMLEAGCFRAGRPAASSRADLLALPHNPNFQARTCRLSR